MVSIHAPHAGRDMIYGGDVLGLAVSIHAPHAGRDAPHGQTVGKVQVSIHAPHAGRDSTSEYGLFDKVFQSTRPMRGATDV